MNYSPNIEGFEGQKIEVRMSFWSGPKLLVNDKPAPKGSKRGQMTLQRSDGRQVIATWKQQLIGMDVPQLVVDGKVIFLVQPLKWYEWVWGGLPALLVFVGGALGAIAGLIAFSVNAKIFRMDLNGVLKYVLSGLVSLLAIVVYLIVAILFSMLIGK